MEKSLSEEPNGNHHLHCVEAATCRREHVIDSLLSVGCDDGTVGRSMSIQFCGLRPGIQQPDEAVLSAVNDIERIGDWKSCGLPDAAWSRMADIAARTGRTRESVRLLISGARARAAFRLR